MPRQPVDTTAADILADAGRALFGEHWSVPTAEKISGNPDTIRRFMSGRMAVPDAVLVKIQAAVRKRVAELKAIDKRIDALKQKKGARP